MFKVGDNVFVDEHTHKHFTITGFYRSVGEKDCVYISPDDGKIPTDINDINLYFSFNGQCGLMLARLTHTTALTPDWEV